MSKMLIGLALSALVASAAVAQQDSLRPGKGGAQSWDVVPQLRPLVGPYGPHGEVILEGKVIGQDPDENIRSQILREYPSMRGE